MDFQSIFPVFLITYLRWISVYSLPKLITKCMVVTLRATATASRCCWRPPRFKYRSWGRNIIFPLYLIHSPLLKQKRCWLLQCALAYATQVSMLLISFKRILFKIFKFVHLKGSLAPNTTCIFVVRVLAQLRTNAFLHRRRNFLNGIGNWALACIASRRWCMSGIM